MINESASLFLCHTWARYDIPLFFRFVCKIVFRGTGINKDYFYSPITGQYISFVG